MQERLEASRWGRAALSVALVAVLASIVVWNLPESHVRREAMPAARPVLRTLGLDQAWNVFAPDPRRHVLDLVARVTNADGTRRTWRIPAHDPFLGEYREYRWQKLMESVVRDDQRQLWDDLAAWVARTRSPAGGRPVRVTLVRRWRDLAPPDAGGAEPPWQEHEFHTYEVGE